ncbi:MAG: RcnB family protein, partial [Caulobacterales bacterium]
AQGGGRMTFQGQPRGGHTWQGGQGGRGGEGGQTWQGGHTWQGGRGGEGGQVQGGARNFARTPNFGDQHWNGGQGGGRPNGQGDRRFAQDQGGVRGGQDWRGGDRGFRGDNGDRGGDRGGLRDGHDRRGDRGGDWRHERFDRDDFPRDFDADRRFHIGFFYPQGWYYENWAYGDYLPWGWFGPSYYLDWNYYGLPPAPAGCEWVREGPDAVLVDVYTGQVLSVYHGLFY